MALPDFNSEGDLPEGVHRATLSEVVARFGSGTAIRQQSTDSLLFLLKLVQGTGCLHRFVIFGSYVTAKAEPNDIDVFLVMSASFNVDDQTRDTREVFGHGRAQKRFRASVFWVSQLTSFASIDYLIEGWQTKRNRSRRGIVELVL
jgi:hypothetical protein